MEGSQQQPAGWYPDPEQPGTQRYWDGAQWTDQRAPAAQQVPQQKKGGGIGKGCLISVLVVLGLGVLGIGACALVISGAEDEQNEHAITRGQFDETGLGTTQSEIEDRFGSPGDAQDFQNEGLPGEEASKSSCIYYNEKDQELGRGRLLPVLF